MALRRCLIASKVIIAIDHRGAQRSFDYLPYPPGGWEGMRGDMAFSPGGGIDVVDLVEEPKRLRRSVQKSLWRAKNHDLPR
eukprot:4254563-Amphidinium_carterae.1